MDCLTRAEAEERLRYAPEDGKFCPDCLSELVGSIGDSFLFCSNEMCLNEAQYTTEGQIILVGES